LRQDIFNRTSPLHRADCGGSLTHYRAVSTEFDLGPPAPQTAIHYSYCCMARGSLQPHATPFMASHTCITLLPRPASAASSETCLSGLCAPAPLPPPPASTTSFHHQLFLPPALPPPASTTVTVRRLLRPAAPRGGSLPHTPLIAARPPSASVWWPRRRGTAASGSACSSGWRGTSRTCATSSSRRCSHSPASCRRGAAATSQ